MIRLGVLMWIWLVAGAAGVLFNVSYDVTSLEDDLAALNRDIVREQEAIRVLRAEWAFLNQPERLRTLAEELTNLVPIAPAQVIESVASLPMPLPEPDIGAEPIALEMVLARIVGTEDPALQTVALPPPAPARRPLAEPAPTAERSAPPPPAESTAEPAAEALDRGGLASLLTDLGIEQASDGAGE